MAYNIGGTDYEDDQKAQAILALQRQLSSGSDPMASSPVTALSGGAPRMGADPAGPAPSASPVNAQNVMSDVNALEQASAKDVGRPGDEEVQSAKRRRLIGTLVSALVGGIAGRKSAAGGGASAAAAMEGFRGSYSNPTETALAESGERRKEKFKGLLDIYKDQSRMKNASANTAPAQVRLMEYFKNNPDMLKVYNDMRTRGSSQQLSNFQKNVEYLYSIKDPAKRALAERTFKIQSLGMGGGIPSFFNNAPGVYGTAPAAGGSELDNYLPQ